FRSPEAEPLGAALECHGAHQSNDAEQMIGVHVCKKDVFESERDAVAHHLSLRSLTTIEHERFTLAVNRQGGNVAFDRRPRSGCAKKTNAQRHGGQYSARVESFLRAGEAWNVGLITSPPPRHGKQFAIRYATALARGGLGDRKQSIFRGE